MELRKSVDFRKVLATLCFLVATFCFAQSLAPAEALQYEIAAELSIPSINLDADVTTLKLEDHRLKTPDTIVGSFSRNKNKTLLIGHATTVFKNLKNILVGDKINYDDAIYKVESVEIIEKADADMGELLKSADRKTLVIMTCAGELYDNGDASHRLVVTAISE